MLRGRTVSVSWPAESLDGHGNVARSWSEPVDVADVLVAPGKTSDASSQGRSSATRRAVALAFPKSFDRSLRGARVSVDGRDYSVVGDPMPSPAELTPTRWWLSAEAVAVDG